MKVPAAVRAPNTVIPIITTLGFRAIDVPPITRTPIPNKHHRIPGHAAYLEHCG